MNGKPSWEHDCPTCRFLGTTIGNKRSVDLYVHEGPTEVTLLARYSSDPPDYASCPSQYAHANGHAELFAALALWKAGKPNEATNQVPKNLWTGLVLVREKGAIGTPSVRHFTLHADPEHVTQFLLEDVEDNGLEFMGLRWIGQIVQPTKEFK